MGERVENVALVFSMDHRPAATAFIAYDFEGRPVAAIPEREIFKAYEAIIAAETRTSHSNKE